MSDEHGDIFGQEQYSPPPPLTAQEQEILKTIIAEVRKAGEDFMAWKRESQNRNPQCKVTFNGTLKGETLERLRFLHHFAVGLKSITKEDLAKQVIEMGVNALYSTLMQHHLRQMIQVKQLEMLPPELRDAVITDMQRKSIHAYAEACNKQSSVLKELRDVRPLDDGSSDIPAESAAMAAGGKPLDAKVCELCGEAATAKKPLVPYQGKLVHADCALDAWEKQKGVQG